MNTKRYLLLVVLATIYAGSLFAPVKATTKVQSMLKGFSSQPTAKKITLFTQLFNTVASGSFTSADDNAIHNALGVSISTLRDHSNADWTATIPAIQTDLTAWNAPAGDTVINATDLVKHVNTLGNMSLFNAIFPDGRSAYENALATLTGNRTIPTPPAGGGCPVCPTGADLQAIFNATGTQLTTIQSLITDTPIVNLTFLGTDATTVGSFTNLQAIANIYAGELQAEILDTYTLLQGGAAGPGQIASLANFAYTAHSSLSSMVYQVINYLNTQLAAAGKNNPATGGTTGIVADIRSIFAGGTIAMTTIQPLLTGSPDVSLLAVTSTGDYATTKNQAVGIVTAMKQALVNGSGTTPATGTLSTGVIDALNGLASIAQDTSKNPALIFGINGITNDNTGINAALTLLTNTLFSLNGAINGVNINGLTQVPSLLQQNPFSSTTTASTQISAALTSLQTLATQGLTAAAAPTPAQIAALKQIAANNAQCELLSQFPVVNSGSTAGSAALANIILSELTALAAQNQTVATAARTAGVLSAQNAVQTITFTLTVNNSTITNPTTYTPTAGDTVVITNIQLGTSITA